MLSLPPLFPLTPSHSLSPPLTPWAFLGLPGSLGPSWGLRKPLEPSQTSGSLGSSVRLRDLASLLPLTPSCSLLLPRPPWVPGTFLGPQEALGAFTRHRQPWVFSETQGPCFPYSSSPPLTPSCPLSLPRPLWAPGTFLGPQEALGTFRSLQQPWLFLPQNFLAHGGDLQRPFAAMWMDIGWGLYFQVVGTHKHYMSSSKFFPPLVVGALKPSITFISLPSLPLAPLAPSCPLSLPSCSPCSLSLPLAPSHPLPPQRWWGHQNIV